MLTANNTKKGRMVGLCYQLERYQEEIRDAKKVYSDGRYTPELLTKIAMLHMQSSFIINKIEKTLSDAWDTGERLFVQENVRDVFTKDKQEG